MMASVPLVSISCITFNHGPYIRQCLDGFFLQQCNFDFEILIYDDASTDGTSDIIGIYQKKYPDIVKPIIQKENQYSQGVRGIMARFNYPRAKGKYIAMCEGDDYWTDPLKLQKQVDFLEEHPEYSLAFTGRIVVDRDGNTLREEMPSKSVFNIVDVFSGYFPTTQTIVFRNNPFITQYFSSTPNIYSGDWTIAYLNALLGKLYCLQSVTAAYRETGKGVWTRYSELEKALLLEESINQFHLRIGWDVNDPVYVFKVFDRLLVHLIRGLRNPGYFFQEKYRAYFAKVWKTYRFMNRSKILALVIYKHIVKRLKRLF